jgi:hypothetical protein
MMIPFTSARRATLRDWILMFDDRMATNRLITIAIITVLVLLIIAVIVSKFR